MDDWDDWDWGRMAPAGVPVLTQMGTALMGTNHVL